MPNKNAITVILIIIFIIGSGIIIYRGRPIMQLNNSNNAINAESSGQAAASLPADEDQNLGDDDDLAAGSSAKPSITPVSVSPNTQQTTDHFYTMSDVAGHATPASCWSAINGSVYDLTTWINRHPGGPEAIQIICGKDGSGLFNNQHSGSKRTASALILLKIGTLKS